MTDPTLYVGQWVLLPGAKGAPIPAPAIAAVPAGKATTVTSSSSGSASPTVRSSSGGARSQYTGGRFTWPVPGGFISQYFHPWHLAIDIAGDYGIPVIAAAPGSVTFSGWKNNGGGYQVWEYLGNNIYISYNHMSALTVGAGQHVEAGQQVGRLGMTGDATGPHLHFDVWIGPIWGGGYAVNPMNYF